MNTETEHTQPTPFALPAGIALEDLVAAVSRGVREALAAEDDVNGYAFGSIGRPLVLTTIVFCPTPPPPPDPRVGSFATVANPGPP